MTFLTAINASLGGYGGFIAVGGGVLILLAAFKVFKAKKQRNMFLLIGIAAIVIPVFISGSLSELNFFAAGIGAGGASQGGNIATNQGDAATVYLKAYDAEAASSTLVYPLMTVFDQNKAVLLDGTSAASVSTTIGNTVDIYGADNTSYYLDQKLVQSVPNAAPTINLVAHSVANTTTLNVYDDVMTVLGNGANNTDYNVSLGATEAKIQYLKLTNTDSYSLYRLGAICSFRTNATAINKVEVVEAGWNRVHIPKAIKDVSATIQLSIAAPAISYYDCWAPSSSISLKAYDSVTIKTRTEAGSNQPVAAGSAGYGFIALDTGSSKGKDGTVSSDFYVHDDNENVNTIGYSETVTSPYGKTATGVAITAN